jgi:cytochrome c-type biogenesis protein CcmE
MKIKYIVGGIIIISFIIWAGISFNKTLTPYVSIKEAKTVDSIVQVKGQRLDSGRFDLETNEFIFTMQDEKGESIEVVYGGAKPGNFDQATEIVCIGQYKSGKFHAKELLVKCPSKYMEEETKV